MGARKHSPGQRRHAFFGTFGSVGPRDVATKFGEKAVVADAMKAFRQDVDEEASDELVSTERHRLPAGAAVLAIVLPAEGDVAFIGSNEPSVRDRRTMRI